MPRPSRPPLTTTVAETTWITPHMVRIVVTGPDLDGFTVGEFTDHYVKCRFGETNRTYTVRGWDPEHLRLTLDFVVHGDEGLAGPWAATAQPGDTLLLNGPGGGYTPSESAAWHLLAGDESVIPAISVALARIPAGVPVFTVIEVDGPEYEMALETPGDLNLAWVHRTDAVGTDPNLQVDVIRELELPAGTGHAFVHGEAESVLRIRHHLLHDRGMARDQMSATGYWKFRRTDEQWRDEKRDWIAAAEADADAAA
jgi:NADPH-dependent ferric siderophore reductase